MDSYLFSVRPAKKLRRILTGLIQATACASLFLAASAMGASFTFDGNTGTTGAQDGSGAWDTTTVNWWTGAVDQAWHSAGAAVGDTAIFGAGSGTAGTITVGTVTANHLTFNTTGAGSYLLSGGTITLAGTTPGITTNVNATISSVLAGSAGLVKDGTGILELTGTNTFIGGVNVNAGTLLFSSTGAGSGLAANTLVTVASGATLEFTATNPTPNNASAIDVTLNGGTYLFSGGAANTGTHVRNLTFTDGGSMTSDAGVGSFNGSNVNLKGDVAMTTAGTASITLEDGLAMSAATTQNWTIATGGNLTVATTLLGSAPLNKAGAGTLTLSGANTYTGGTTVAAGTFLVTNTSGSASGSGTLTLSSDGSTTSTLAGTGTVGAVSIPTATSLATHVAPGLANHGIGNLTTGNLSIGNFTLLDFDLGVANTVTPGSSDHIQVNGTFTADGYLNITAATGFGNATYRLIDSTGTLTDNTIILNAVPMGYASYSLTTDAINKRVNLAVGAYNGLAFWDGGGVTPNATVDGGTGTWSTGINWTSADGNGNGVWVDNLTPVFQTTTAASAVTITSPVSVHGMTFNTTGYTLSGSTVTLGDTTAITVASGATAIVNSVLAGSNGLTKAGTGTLTLSGGSTSTYTGTTTINAGTLNVGASNQIPDGSNVSVATSATFNIGANFSELVKSIQGTGTVNIGSLGSLYVQSAVDSTFSGALTGASNGVFWKYFASTVTLSGTSSFSGTTNIKGGTLLVTNTGLGTGAITLSPQGDAGNTSATLGGTGTVGAVDAPSATALGVHVAPGLANHGIGNLTTGNFSFGHLAQYDFDLGVANTVTPGSSDHLQINGTFTADGYLNVVAATGFGNATYRLIDFTGTLTNTGITLNSVPLGYASYSLVTDAPNKRVNLTVGAFNGLAFWDGANVTPNSTIDGGTGTWNLAGGPINWTSADGNGNGSWTDNLTPVFQGTAGTATLASLSVVSVHGMTFNTAGYTLTGGTVTLGDTTAINTNNTGLTTIASALAGSSGLTKTGNAASTLVLTGANTYTGGTTISTGTLQVGNGGTTGNLGGGNVVNNAALVFNRSDSVSVTNAISGSGSVTKSGGGAVALSGSNSYLGATAVTAGTLQVGVAGAGSTGSGAVTVGNTAALSGSGTVKGSSFTAQSGSTVAPGDGVSGALAGTLTFQPASGAGSFTFASGSTINLTLTAPDAHDATYGGTTNPGAPGYDAWVESNPTGAAGLAGTGVHDLLKFDGAAGSTVAFNGTVTLTLASYTPVKGDVFDLADWTTNVTASFAGLTFNLPNLGPTLGWDTSHFDDSGKIVVVPEINSSCLMLLGLGIMTLRARRRAR